MPDTHHTHHTHTHTHHTHHAHTHIHTYITHTHTYTSAANQQLIPAQQEGHGTSERTGGRGLQRLQSGEGLPGVGGTDVANDFPAQAAGERVPEVRLTESDVDTGRRQMLGRRRRRALLVSDAR
jgi:hypothetical protein